MLGHLGVERDKKERRYAHWVRMRRREVCTLGAERDKRRRGGGEGEVCTLGVERRGIKGEEEEEEERGTHTGCGEG